MGKKKSTAQSKKKAIAREDLHKSKAIEPSFDTNVKVVDQVSLVLGKHLHRHEIVDGNLAPEVLDALKDRHPKFYDELLEAYPLTAKHERRVRWFVVSYAVLSLLIGQLSVVAMAFFVILPIAQQMVASGGTGSLAATVMIVVVCGLLVGVKMLDMKVNHNSEPSKNNKTLKRK